jgi:hypothetical protein
MKRTLTSALLALSVLGSIASVANADTYPHGDKTAPQQEQSPN